MNKQLKMNFLLLVMAALLCSFHVVSYAAEESLSTEQGIQYAPVQDAWEFGVDLEKSSINFFLDGNVHDTHGAAGKMEGKVTVVVNADGKVSEAGVTITLHAEDLDTKNEGRDKKMKNEFLETEKYPKIVFQSTKIETGADEPVLTHATKDDPMHFDLYGELSLHGKTKEITVQGDAYLFENKIIVDGDSRLDLRDFAIKNPSLMFLRVDNEVKIDFHIESLKLQENQAKQ